MKKTFLISLLLLIGIFIIFNDSSSIKAKDNNKAAPTRTLTDDILLMKYSLFKEKSWIPLDSGRKIPTIPFLVDARTEYRYVGLVFPAYFDYQNPSSVTINQGQNASRNLGIRQEIKTIPNHYYQFSVHTTSYVSLNDPNRERKTGDGFNIFDGATTNYIKDSLVDSVYNRIDYTVSNGSEKTRQNRVIFQAKSNLTTVELTIFSNGSLNWNSAAWKNVSLIDFEEGIDTSKKLVEALFTDNSHTAIKLSTTQIKINEIKQRVNDLFDPTIKSELLAEIAKAQKLLDKVSMFLTVENLNDDRDNTSSYTLQGKTYPNSFLSFSGHEFLPKGKLYSEVGGDKLTYQIRADNQGNFHYSLPEKSYFRGGQRITIVSMLHGKSTQLTKTVEDVTAPFKPILLPLKDTSSKISGEAETEAVVKLYDATNNTLILSGKADFGDQYTLAIPEPLSPYKQYYVTATDASGHISERSNIQEVQDTQPPSATPVKQRIKLGSPLPKIDQLITDVSDNAGKENLTIIMTKEPNLLTIGYTEAIITISDQAQNSIIVTVPVFVIDDNLVEDGTTILSANDFSILAIDFPEKSDDQKAFILEKSGANAWDSTTWMNKKDEIILHSENMRKEPGIYEINISLGKLTKKFNVELTSGELAFKKVPSKISFGEPTIKSRTQYISTDKGINLLISDSRFTQENWRLMTKLNQPLQTETGEKTQTDIVFKNGTDLTALEENKTVELFKKNSEQRDIELSFSNNQDQEFLLQMSPGSVLANKVYTAEVMWLIELAP